MNYRIALISCSLLLLGVLPHSVQAFVDNDARPPRNNAPAPINVSNTFQIKNGGFQSNSNIRAPLFYDSNDTNYFLRPSRVSRLNTLFVSNLNAPTIQSNSINTDDAFFRSIGRSASEFGRKPILKSEGVTSFPSGREGRKQTIWIDKVNQADGGTLFCALGEVGGNATRQASIPWKVKVDRRERGGEIWWVIWANNWTGLTLDVHANCVILY